VGIAPLPYSTSSGRPAIEPHVWGHVGELAGVATIRFDPLTGLSRDERRRNHLATHAWRRHLPLQRIAAGPGFITHPEPPRRLTLELPNRWIHPTRLSVDVERWGVIEVDVKPGLARWEESVDVGTDLTKLVRWAGTEVGARAVRVCERSV